MGVPIQDEKPSFSNIRSILSALWCHSLRVLAERAADDAEGGRLRRIAERTAGSFGAFYCDASLESGNAYVQVPITPGYSIMNQIQSVSRK